MKKPDQLRVAISEKEAVTSLVYRASRSNRAGVTVLLGHGAGAGQLSGFMTLYANGLAARGCDAITFDFVYMEQRRHVPDSKAKLESCYRAVIETALNNKSLSKNRLIIGGKSMGGRIASQVAATAAQQSEPIAKRISGLVLLGYPLHPPGNLAKLRTEHLPAITMPILFVQGTRDAFGTPEEIRPLIKKFRLAAELYEVAGGDHSFKVPKSSGLTPEQVHDEVMNEIVRWATQPKRC